jgi:hypothetical protein
MVQATKKPGIEVIQTPKGLLARGFLPGITDLEVDIQEHNVTFSGNSMHGEFQEELALQRPINIEYSITAFQDYQLRIVMPWRNKR